MFFSRGAFWIELFEQADVGEQHVVGFVHRGDGVAHGSGLGIAARHAQMVARVGTLGAVGVAARGAPGFESAVVSHG